MAEEKKEITLYRVFRTPTQVRIIEELLKKPDEYFTLSRMAKTIGASPSAISQRIDELLELDLIKFVPGSEKTKIFRLNRDSPITKALIELYHKLKELNQKI